MAGVSEPMQLGRVALVLIGVVACGGSDAARPPPAPAAAPAGNPCFAGAPPLVADDVHKQFEKHADFLWAGSDTGAPPPETFGTCTVHEGNIRAADGTVVAEIGCGLQINVRGIRDDLGIEIGARGADVLSAWTEPHGQMECLGNGPSQTRCRYDRAEDSDTDFTAYIVAGGLPAGSDALTGAAAERFFAEREIVQIWHSVWCH